MISQCRPSDIRFLMALPSTKAEFFDALANPAADFVPRICPWWSKYEEEIARPFNRFHKLALSVGCELWSSVTRRRFVEAFDGTTQVVVLFAHWGDGLLELADGMVSVDCLNEELPREFSGIVDLTVCHPWTLVSALKNRWPNSIVKHAVDEIIVALWWPFYEALVTEIARTQGPFLETFVSIANMFASEE